MTEVQAITLATLADGAAGEMWGAALDKVLENIDDPNTDPEAKRAIVLTITFEPDAQRRTLQTGIVCVPKLAGVKAATSTVFLGRDHGVLKAVEAPAQDELFTDPKSGPRAVEKAGVIA